MVSGRLVGFGKLGRKIMQIRQEFQFGKPRMQMTVAASLLFDDNYSSWS